MGPPIPAIVFMTPLIAPATVELDRRSRWHIAGASADHVVKAGEIAREIAGGERAVSKM